MSDLSQRIAALSPQKRDLLLQQLRRKGSDGVQTEVIRRRAATHTYPLSFAQRRLWFLDQYQPGSAFYNIAAALRLRGTLDVTALTRSLNEIVRRHEVLRSTYRIERDEPVQAIAPVLEIDLPVIDRPGAGEREIREFADLEAQRPFDLSRGPLLRATLLRAGERDHTLVLVLHHIVADGWSTGIFFHELAQHYRAFSTSQVPNLPELPLQYADFAHWQNEEQLKGDFLAEQIAYWTKQISGAPPVLELPTDRPHPAVQTHRGATLVAEYPREICDRAMDFCRREGVTPFVVLYAAFQVLLARYSGQEDICCGIPIANRRRAELEVLIGFFVNTLVLRTDLSGEPDFQTMVRRVQETWLAAEAHQDLPFEMLVEAMQPERDLSRSPLFQVMFAFQQPAPMPGLPGLEIELIELETGTAKFDLLLTVEPGKESVRTIWEYNTDLFDRRTIERLSGHYRTLLEGGLKDPARPISLLPLLTSEESRRLLVEWNATELALPGDRIFPDLFAEQVERTPDAIAVFYEGEQVTFAELNRRANQLAWRLRRLGVGPDKLVGLFTERSVETIVGVVGILKAGGAYLPLDPSYPQERLAFILEESQAGAVLTQSRLLDRLAGLRGEGAAGVPILRLDGDEEEIGRESVENPPSLARGDNLAYVIYTSGSTGRPKGVMIEHRSVINHAAGLQHQIYRPVFGRDPRPGLRVSLNAPLMFDASVQEWVMLMHGHGLYILPQEVRLDGKSLLAYIRRHRLDVFDCVPSQLKLLLEEGFLDENEWMPALVLPGGEAIDDALWQSLTRFPRTEFYNVYGPTECTVDSATCSVKSYPHRPTIGGPMTNFQFYLLDRHLQPVPIGVSGEIYIGGAGVGRGYLNRPDLTAERFVPNPFDSRIGSRLYKSGDQARYLPDGKIEYLGRLDDQVKVRGFRVELGEIEAALREHPAVAHAAVIAQRLASGEHRLAAYYVKSVQGTVTANDLRSYLKDRLPDYMAPSAFAQLEALPLLPNGKLDRRALPALEIGQLELAGEYVAPRTPTEELLAGIWSRLLEVERVGAHDNFFELGGHSLMATRIASRIREAFKVELPLRAIFEQPTIAGLAECIERERAAHLDLETPPIVPVSREGELPLSYSQLRLWFLDQLEPGSNFYNIPSAVRLRGELDRAALERSFDRIVRRHEIMRTVFPCEDGKARQVILSDQPAALPIDDLAGPASEESEAELQARILAEARAPFDLAAGPLWRARLFRLGEQDHVLLLVQHHIISDGWSMNLLIEEVGKLYAAFRQEQTMSQPEPEIQYPDYASWQRGWLAGKVREKQLAYWRDQLQGHPAYLALPTDHPRPKVQRYEGAKLSLPLSPELLEKADRLGRDEGATLFMTMLAAFHALLYRYSGQESINVGTPIAGRSRAEVENMLGCFINTLVIRGDVTGDPGFRELLRRVRDAALGAYAHQDLPFEVLVDELQPERDLSHSPLFQVMFVLQQPAALPDLPGLAVQPLDIDAGTAKFDLLLAIEPSAQGCRMAWEYNIDLFTESTIRRLAAHFEQLLSASLAEPEKPVSLLSMLPETERELILCEFNRTDYRFPEWRETLPGLWAARAIGHPESPALVFQGNRISYAELDRRTSQLANYLMRMGVEPNDRVGLMVERSMEMVIGLLGILKAGAAYIPLDPSYPPERLGYVLSDARPRVMLTLSPLAGLAGGIGNGLPATWHTVYLDSDWERIELEPEASPAPPITGDNRAYIIYTSGSTGKPKGVVVRHRGVCNLALDYIRQMGMGVGDKMLQFASLSFDASITEIFATLMSGATLVLAPREELVDLEALERLLRQERITTALLPPPMLKLLPAEGLPDLRRIISAGEKCTPEIVARWGIGRDFYNGYGPTETTVGPTLYRVEDPTRIREYVPIGRPIANVRIYLLDRHLQPVPIGVPGELCVAGVGLAEGYLNRPELTAEKFIDWQGIDPDGKPATIRLYRTGDLARYLPDGNLVFIDRLDQQVKIRGYRIELGEIEAVLRQYPGIREVAVAPQSRPDGEPYLVAYCVTESDQLAPANVLRDYLKQQLPEYMIPAAFTRMEALPFLPNGKVDRRLLPVPEPETGNGGREEERPRTATEEMLAQIWGRTLGIERVGVNDNFFALGGDSILSIQVISRARQAGIEITPKQLFENPTIGELAKVAGSQMMAVAEQGLVTGATLLTPIQQWFLDQDQPHPEHWNQTVLFEVRQSLDRGALEKALEYLLTHHDALRMRFWREDGEWKQYNAGMEAIRIGEAMEVVDYSHLSDDELAAAIERHASSVQESLRLREGPLLRMVYFDLGPERRGRLLIVIHHLVVDGVSWRILLEDLQSAYRQLLAGRQPTLPRKTTSFQQWAGLLSSHAQSDEVHRELDYWISVTHGKVAQLPKDFPAGENTEASLRQIVVSLDETETQALLKDVPAAFGTEINDALLTSLAIVLCRWKRSSEAVLHLEGHGREEILEEMDLSRTVGWFTTQFPVRLEVPDGESIDDSLKQVKEQLRRIPNHGIGYTLLRYLSQRPGVRELLRSTPQPAVLFNYLGQFGQSLPEEGLLGMAREPVGHSRSQRRWRNHLIEINSGIVGKRLEVEWGYSELSHRRETIQALAEEFIAVLRRLIAHCSDPSVGGYTPSDFPDVELSEEQLETLIQGLD